MKGSAKGHKQIAGRIMRYTVYDNNTDFPVCVDVTAPEAAAAMGLKMTSFYCAVARKGKVAKWHIEKSFADEAKTEDEYDY